MSRRCRSSIPGGFALLLCIVAQAEAPFVLPDSCLQSAVEYVTNPVIKRVDYPGMPPHNYLSRDVHMAAAEYMPKVEN